MVLILEVRGYRLLVEPLEPDSVRITVAPRGEGAPERLVGVHRIEELPAEAF